MGRKPLPEGKKKEQVQFYLTKPQQPLMIEFQGIMEQLGPEKTEELLNKLKEAD